MAGFLNISSIEFSKATICFFFNVCIYEYRYLFIYIIPDMKLIPNVPYQIVGILDSTKY